MTFSVKGDFLSCISHGGRDTFALADHLIPAVRLGDLEVKDINVKFYRDIGERMEHGSLEGKKVDDVIGYLEPTSGWSPLGGVPGRRGE